MKKYSSLLFTGLLCLLSFFGCKKEAPDYRDRYQGSFDMKLYSYQYLMGTGIFNKVDETNRGDVFYKKGEENKGRIWFKYKDSKEPEEFKVDESGMVFSSSCNTQVGQFTDTDHFNLAWDSNTCGSGGLGGGWRIWLEGSRVW